MFIVRWIERLSLDAVVVACLWGLGLSIASGRQPDPAQLVIIALATWLTYVADRLRDASVNPTKLSSDRHVYYQNNYTTFAMAWAVIFLLSVGLALMYLPIWKWAGGWVIVASIILYLWLLGKRLPPGGRMVLKRTVVPIIFTGGIIWMTESWQTAEGILASLALFGGATLNLLLISSYENRDKPALAWLANAFKATWIIALIFGVADAFLGTPLNRPGLSVLIFSSLYLLVYLASQRHPSLPVRFLADTSLTVAIIPLLLQ